MTTSVFVSLVMGIGLHEEPALSVHVFIGTWPGLSMDDSEAVGEVLRFAVSLRARFEEVKYDSKFPPRFPPVSDMFDRCSLMK